jgi:hypothetical protein
VTGQALVATSREPFPLSTVPRAKQPGGLAAPVAGPSQAPGESAPGTGPGPGGGDRAGSRGDGDGGGGGAGAAAEEGAGEVVYGNEAVADTAPAADEPEVGSYEQASEEEGLGTSAWVVAGLVVLAGALVGGFFLYRRRLP